MSTVIDNIERAQLRRVPSFAPGDRVKVHFQVIEGTRRRIQVFEGVVIKRQGHGARETFTVRKQSFGVGVERTFPVHSPKIERIELAARGDVRRAKLYYLRDRVGKRARVRERRYTGPEEAVEPGLLVEPSPSEPSQPQETESVTAEEAVAQSASSSSESQGGAEADAQAATEGEAHPRLPPERGVAGRTLKEAGRQAPAAEDSAAALSDPSATAGEADSSSSDAGDAPEGEPGEHPE